MNIDTFAIIGGDLRSVYTARHLAADGYKVIANGFDNIDLPSCVTGCTSAVQTISLADCIILPVPVTTDEVNINAPYSNHEIPFTKIIENISPKQKIMGGAVPYDFMKLAEEHDHTIIDYLAREELAVYNAIPTAEGALQLALEELPITIRGSRCLITGYGRIGRILSQMLVALGAEVVVGARRFSDHAWAHSQGCTPVALNEINKQGTFDVIFNTIPTLIFDKRLLRKLDKNTLIIDLASKPGGVDFSTANELKIKTIWALSLPGKVAPKSAGIFIKNTIINILKEH